MTGEPTSITKRRREPQSGLFDIEIENPELEAAIELMEAADEAVEAAIAEFIATRAEGNKRALSGARKLYKETVENICRERSLGSDQRIRVGRYVVTTVRRAGGGFEVPDWSKTLPKGYSRIDATE